MPAAVGMEKRLRRQGPAFFATAEQKEKPMRRRLLTLAVLTVLSAPASADATSSGPGPVDVGQGDGAWTWFGGREDGDRTTTGSIEGDYARGQATCQNGPGISPLDNAQCNVFGGNGD